MTRFRLRYHTRCLLLSLRYQSLSLLSALFLLPLTPAVPADDTPLMLSFTTPLVRVNLTRFVGAKTVTLSAEPGARIVGAEGNALATGTGPWTISLTGKTVQITDANGRPLGTGQANTLWRLQGEDAETQVRIGASGGSARLYRGSLEVQWSAGRLTVINEVALESYLRGVVASEMGGSAPLEALKAQAVAARTFALYRLLRRTSAEAFDLRDDTQDQAYKGAEAERDACDRAVLETSGLILTKDGKPIPALYSADCGGVTAPGTTPEDFPHSVSDADAHGPPDNPRPPAWTLRYTPESLLALLNKNASLRVNNKLEAIETVERDTSGRVKRLRFLYKNGETREIAGTAFRSLLGVNTFRSTLFTVTREATGEFVFNGRGWGHGRGLCQNGAMTLAAPPLSRDFRAILNRYYAGAALSKIQYSDSEEAVPDAPK